LIISKTIKVKLAIKNYKKATGWSFSYDRKSTDFWKIYSAEEFDDTYRFSAVLEDIHGNRLASKAIVLSRIPRPDRASYNERAYSFLPHKKQEVTADWFSDTDNVYKVFEGELLHFL
jgi:hypothetical protein